MNRFSPSLACSCVLLLGTALHLSASEPAQMAGVWRGHSTGKQNLAFGIARTESDDQFTISKDLRSVVLLPLSATTEISGKSQKAPVHSAPATLTTTARLEKGDLVVQRTVRHSTGGDRQTWTFHLQSPSTLHVKFASSYLDTAGGQISWYKTEGTLQRQ